MAHYAAEQPLHEARADYFARNDFGDDGGYAARFAWFEMGPLRVPILNTAQRRYAVRYHDLHHIATGYPTDWRGEFEISGFEIGAGCGRAWFAWHINLGGLLGGLVFARERTVRAFYRGRQCRCLYGEDTEALLTDTVGQARRRMGLDAPPGTVTASDRLALVGWALFSLGYLGAQVAFVLGVLGWLFA